MSTLFMLYFRWWYRIKDFKFLLPLLSLIFSDQELSALTVRVKLGWKLLTENLEKSKKKIKSRIIHARL